MQYSQDFLSLRENPPAQEGLGLPYSTSWGRDLNRLPFKAFFCFVRWPRKTQKRLWLRKDIYDSGTWEDSGAEGILEARVRQGGLQTKMHGNLDSEGV